MTKVLAISGSLRDSSYNTMLLRNAIELFGADVVVEELDGLKVVPPYDEDDDGDGAPEAVRSLRAAFAGADRGKHLAELGLGPYGAERTGGRADDDCRLVPERVCGERP